MSNEHLSVARSLENTEINLEYAWKLIVCFLEFCNDEGYSSSEVNKSTFVIRMEQYDALLRSALGILELERKNLYANIDKIIDSAKAAKAVG